jgi:AAA15 family ATPase/GTPase
MRITIKNFKSIKNLELTCGRVNVFIGEPNTGKSNLLEAIVGLQSYIAHGGELRDFTRIDRVSNMFYDCNLDDEIVITIDSFEHRIKYEYNSFVSQMVVPKNGSIGSSASFPYGSHSTSAVSNFCKVFKFYRFKPLKSYSRKNVGYLLPACGENLPAVYLTNKEVKSTVMNILNKYGLKVVIDQENNEIRLLKLLEDVVVMIPYPLLSDTFQRLIFYLSAILTNKNSIIALEEPEAHAFPYYTKYLAELIALVKNDNRYFITTHNPYFLHSLIEKTPKKDLRVFITYYEDFQTKVKMLDEEDIKDVLDEGIDVFFNIDRFLEGDG